MNRVLTLALAVPLLCACGAETASTAATAAAVKKQELEQGRQTMEQMQRQIGDTLQQAPRRADD